MHVQKSQENKPTMSNANVPPNATTCCDCGEEVLARARVDVVAITVFSLVVFALCLILVLFIRLREKMALQAQLEENAASQDSKEKRRRTRKEFISNGLIVREWVPPFDPPVESAEGNEGSPPSGEAVESAHPPAPQINSSLVSCEMGSDDCESLAEEEEMAGCAICLSHFRPEQLVCESNNSSCQHIFHKDCMVDWLTKHNDSCPMCREVYVLKTV